MLSLAVAVPVTAMLLVLSGLLSRWGLDPSVLALARPYLDIVLWSVLPLLFYATFRRYLQGMGVVRPVMIALVTANVINAIVNWILIYGKLVGDPNNTELVPAFSYSSPQVSELPDIDSGHHPFGEPVPIAAADDAVTAMQSLQIQSDLGQRSEAFVWLITALTQANAKLPEAADA